MDANPVKLAAMRAQGAELIEHGRDFDAAREHCAALAEEHGYRYVHSGNEPLLIAGVGTETLEILEDRPDVDVIVVPIGGGSGAAGACVVAKAIRPEIEVIGVQSEAAPAAFRSWQARGLVEDETATFAEGLATRVPFELPQQILWEHLDDFVLVERGRDSGGDAADDRAHAQPRRAGWSGAAGGCAEARRPSPGQADRPRRERRQHQPGAADGALPLQRAEPAAKRPLQGSCAMGSRSLRIPILRRSTQCAGEDLNLHGPKATRPSTLRVYQFRHQRGDVQCSRGLR